MVGSQPTFSVSPSAKWLNMNLSRIKQLKNFAPSGRSNPRSETFLNRGGTTSTEEHLNLSLVFFTLGLVLTDNVYHLNAYNGFGYIGVIPAVWFVMALFVAIASLWCSWRSLLWCRLFFLLLHSAFWFTAGCSLLTNLHWSPAGAVFLVMGFAASRAFWRLLMLDGLPIANLFVNKIKQRIGVPTKV